MGSVNKSEGPKRCGRMSASPYDCLLPPKKNRMVSYSMPLKMSFAIWSNLVGSQKDRPLDKIRAVWWHECFAC